MATLYSEVIGLENTENSLTLGFALVTPSGLKFEKRVLHKRNDDKAWMV